MQTVALAIRLSGLDSYIGGSGSSLGVFLNRLIAKVKPLVSSMRMSIRVAC
jgi:hypothetical protein